MSFLPLPKKFLLPPLQCMCYTLIMCFRGGCKTGYITGIEFLNTLDECYFECQRQNGGDPHTNCHVYVYDELADVCELNDYCSALGVDVNRVVWDLDCGNRKLNH